MKTFGKSENAIVDDFILRNGLKWIPYNKFKNVEYFNEGGFGTIYKATWLMNNGDEEVILKCHKNLNENLNEFLKEWEYHTSVFSSNDIIYFYGFTEDPNTSKYMVVMDYANKDLMKKCWNEDPSKRPSTSEVNNAIKNWIFRPSDDGINEELKSNIMEFINAPIGHNDLATKSHSKACYKSRLLDFTSKKLNEILDSEDSQAYHSSHSDLNDYIIRDPRSLDENTSKKLNEILESESEDLNDCIIKDLGGSLGMCYNI
ncbi:uncharacterized protein OCT59_019238 [Rhizophagus irregularis]|uniref:uncharacterized protein n=1 Tax=Rhizophagus irregularis TaxID=588596 RepID=UPI0033251E13|nr:hypothetical protein OCT59_019238 [Rhizophagus irregularis]